MPFQSSPARGGGCNQVNHQRLPDRSLVSILTRPWGRVQLASQRFTQDQRMAVSILTRPWGRVQLIYTAPFHSISQVSILTRPWGRVQRNDTYFAPAGLPMFQSSPARGGGCNASIS